MTPRAAIGAQVTDVMRGCAPPTTEGDHSMKALFTAAVLAAALLGSAPAHAQIGVHKIGYVGCSNTRDSVTGYHNTKGNRNLFWTPYNTGGGTIDLWANSKSSFWSLFSEQIQNFGQPQVVWVELCENFIKVPDTYAEVQQLLANLKVHAPNAEVFISPINTYNPSAGLCTLMGTAGQGETDTNSWALQAVAAQLASAGPVLGPLTKTLIQSTDATQCHPNSQGELLLGGQLVQFFDMLP